MTKLDMLRKEWDTARDVSWDVWSNAASTSDDITTANAAAKEAWNKHQAELKGLKDD